MSTERGKIDYARKERAIRPSVIAADQEFGQIDCAVHGKQEEHVTSFINEETTGE